MQTAEVPLNTLAYLGVSLSEADRIRLLSPEDRFSEVYQGLMGYKKEVLEDSAVSIPYSYWFGSDRQLYSHPDHHDNLRLVENQIDVRERGGLPLEGFRTLTQTLLSNPDTVVLMYSPSGRASFDEEPNNPYSDITYKNGQLYLQYFDSSENRVQSFAVTVSNDSIIQDLMPDIYRSALREQSYQEHISLFLKNPAVTGIGIHEFLSGDWAENLSNIVYKHHNGKVTTVFDVLAEIRASLSSKGLRVDEHAQRLAHEIAYSNPTPELVFNMYLQVVHSAMKGNQIQLAGSCGGRIVERDSIESLLGITNPFTNNFSSEYRLVTNPLEITAPTSHYDDYECPHCHENLSGESKSNKSSWRSSCDHCGGTLNC
jgi:predicted RNA-binding Zn-ribbon protein involved in translation (DUF1610 family)